MDRGQMGDPVLTSQGLHTRLHHRARLHGEIEARVRQAQHQDHRAFHRSGQRPQELGEGHPGDARDRGQLSDDRRRGPGRREALRHDPSQRERRQAHRGRQRHDPLGVHHRPRQESEGDGEPSEERGPKFRRGPAPARFTAVERQTRGGDAGELEAGPGRDHTDLRVRRGGEEKVSARLQNAQTVSADRGTTEVSAVSSPRVRTDMPVNARTSHEPAEESSSGGRNAAARRAHRAPDGFRRNARHHRRQRYLGPAGRSPHGEAAAASGARARHQFLRYGRQLRASRFRILHRGNAVSLPRGPCHRHQGRGRATGQAPLGPGRPPRAFAPGVGRKLEALEARAHRPLSASRPGPARALRGLGGRARRGPARPQDPAPGGLQRQPEATGSGAPDCAHRLGAKPIQSGEPEIGRRAQSLRTARRRLHPVVSPRRRSGAQFAPREAGGQSAQRAACPSGARVAARAFAGHAPDSRPGPDRAFGGKYLGRNPENPSRGSCGAQLKKDGGTPMQRIAMFLAILGVGTAAALTSGCKNPPTQSDMAAYEYGPRPENYEKLIRDYLFNKLLDPGNAIVEFKAGPKQLFQQNTALRSLQYGWGVCVWINDKNTRGAYDGPYPVVFFIRDGKIVAVNGGGDDNIIGWRYARTGCNELGAPFVTP